MSVDIGKIAVTFSANTESFTRGVGSATSALMDFAKRSKDAGAALDGGFTAGFADTLDAVAAKLNSAALSGEAFGEAVSGAFEKAAKKIDTGLSNSFETLSKEVEAGMVVGEEFAASFGDLSGRAQSAIDGIASESFASLKKAVDDNAMSVEDFASSIAQIAAGEAGAGIDHTRDATLSLTKALDETVITGQEFLALQRELSNGSAAAAARREAEALGAIQEQLDAGKIGIDEFNESLRSIQTSFRVAAAADYEAQIVALTKAKEDATISTEEFDAQQKILRSTLERRFIEQLQDQLDKLPEAYESAGRSAEELAAAQEVVNTRIEAGREAAERIAKRADKKAAAAASSSGEGEGASGIMGGLEKASKVLSIIPGEIGHTSHMIEKIVSVSSAASKALGGLGGAFATLASPLSIAIGATVAVGGAVLKLVNDFSAMAQETKKLSTQFGITLREVSVLQTVLKGAGSNMNEFQNITRSLQKVLVTAADGAGKSSVAFRRLGLDARELKFADAGEQVREVVEALSRVENPAERASLAVQLLGKNGASFAAKFGTSTSEIEESFEHAEQAVERFKTAFTEFDSSQLIKANRDIAGISEATEGLGAAVAAALAPLAAGLGSAVADTIGTITNALVGLTAPVKLVGAVIGEVLRVIGSLANSVARVFSAGMSNIWVSLDAVFKAFSGGIGVIEMVQAAAGGIVKVFEAVASYAERGASALEAWSTGKTVEELEAIKRSQREMAQLGEAAAEVQEKYGDKTEIIRQKIEEVKRLRSTMGDDGRPLITADEASAALNDLNDQLKKASPHIAMMTAETERFEGAMKSASQEAAAMGNNVAQAARARYFAGYEALLEKLKSNKITKELFDESVKGLADKFNKEMEKAKPIKAISDQIEELAKKYNQQAGNAGVAADFAKFEQARMAGGTFVGGVESARLQRISDRAGELGLDAKPRLEGFALYQQRLQEINELHRVAAQGTRNAFEEEKKFNEMRAAASKQLLDDIQKKIGSIGERERGAAEKAIDDFKTLQSSYAQAKAARDTAAASGDIAGIVNAETLMQDIAERRDRNAADLARQNKYEGSGEKAVREFDQVLADIQRARESLRVAGGPESAALDAAERNAREQFTMENLDLVDKAMFGGNADTRAASGIDATSEEGVSTYFRIMREDHSVTMRQLEEARQTRILLQRIYEKPAGVAANI